MKKIVLVITLILLVAAPGCHLSNQKLHKKMIEKYSDDKNYVTLIGEVVECEDNNLILNCEGLKNYLSYEDDICGYFIHSKTIIDLNAGDIVHFTTVPFHFYNGHQLPIVELKSNGNTLLSFDDGKANLIEWVNEHFQ